MTMREEAPPHLVIASYRNLGLLVWCNVKDDETGRDDGGGQLKLFFDQRPAIGLEDSAGQQFFAINARSDVACNVINLDLSEPVAFPVQELAVNATGHMIAMIGTHCVNVIKIPEQLWMARPGSLHKLNSHYTARCTTLFGTGKSVNDQLIQRARWCPSSETDSHIGCLFGDGNFRIFDILNLGQGSFGRRIEAMGSGEHNVSGRSERERSALGRVFGLTTEIVAFDFGPAFPVDVMDTRTILQSAFFVSKDADVYCAAISLASRSILRMDGPLLLHPPCDDNYGLDEVVDAICLLDAGPMPVIVMATSTQTVYQHLLVLSDSKFSECPAHYSLLGYDKLELSDSQTDGMKTPGNNETAAENRLTNSQGVIKLIKDSTTGTRYLISAEESVRLVDIGHWSSALFAHGFGSTSSENVPIDDRLMLTEVKEFPIAAVAGSFSDEALANASKRSGNSAGNCAIFRSNRPVGTFVAVVLEAGSRILAGDIKILPSCIASSNSEEFDKTKSTIKSDPIDETHFLERIRGLLTVTMETALPTRISSNATEETKWDYAESALKALNARFRRHSTIIEMIKQRLPTTLQERERQMKLQRFLDDRITVLIDQIGPLKSVLSEVLEAKEGIDARLAYALSSGPNGDDSAPISLAEEQWMEELKRYDARLKQMPVIMEQLRKEVNETVSSQKSEVDRNRLRTPRLLELEKSMTDIEKLANSVKALSMEFDIQ